jgi:hypothetical protein
MKHRMAPVPGDFLNSRASGSVVEAWVAFDRRSPRKSASALRLRRVGRVSSKAERAAFQRGEGLLIGRDADTGRLLRYDGPAHLITLAPTRAGKGVGTIVPNLLTANRSVLVIDPKGENARITAQARRKFGAVHVLDPFGVTGLPGAAYNPLDRLTPDSLDLGEDAAALAEALVMDPPGQTTASLPRFLAPGLCGGEHGKSALAPPSCVADARSAPRSLPAATPHHQRSRSKGRPFCRLVPSQHLRRSCARRLASSDHQRQEGISAALTLLPSRASLQHQAA